MDERLSKYWESPGRVYLPPTSANGVACKEYLHCYLEKEFPQYQKENAIYSIPKTFWERTEAQASRAEQHVFYRLNNLTEAVRQGGLWVLFFHGASYAGHSYRNQRTGKLMIREHDFVLFTKYNGKHFVTLIEVKSTHDANTQCNGATIVSDARVIKNNKRSAQHQLRDHMEVLHRLLIDPDDAPLQNFIMWPFLGAMTKDPKQEVIRRWKEDADLHVFEDTFENQNVFNKWFRNSVLNSKPISVMNFEILLNRFIILSCGVFVDEIHQGMLALLTQEQIALLNSECGRFTTRGSIVVHGAAGTGKTLLILRKLQMLYERGQLNEHNRALYICYWPGIRSDFVHKLKILGLDKFVDTARYFISHTYSYFLKGNNRNYKHIFMDEAEALCLAFHETIVSNTLRCIYQHYHDGNCTDITCTYDINSSSYTEIHKSHHIYNWGQLWFLVDINQASLFLPKHSPHVLKSPSIVLNRVMRSTGHIFNVFKQFYSDPLPYVPQPLLANMNLFDIQIGHNVNGPPVYWVDSDNDCHFNHNSNNEECILHSLVRTIIDLCATKGIKPNDLCVLPFLVNANYAADTLNNEISKHFVENGYKPHGVAGVEDFQEKREVNDFLVPWALRVKGLEFKVVIMVIERDDFDSRDLEDRKKMYIMASRCTCLLIVVSPREVKDEIDPNNLIKKYPFGIKL